MKGGSPSSTPQLGGLEQMNFTCPSNMNSHDDDDDTSSKKKIFFAEDGIHCIDIEESKDFFNENFRLKHENEAQSTTETRNRHGSDMKDARSTTENEDFGVSESENIEDTPSGIDNLPGFSANNSKIEIRVEQVNIKTENFIKSDIDFACLEEEDEGNKKISGEGNILEDFLIIKQEEIDEADNNTSKNINNSLENFDEENNFTKSLLFFKGFETVEQKSTNILELYNRFLSNELDDTGKPRILDYHEFGVQNRERKSRLLFVKVSETDNNQSIVPYRRRSERLNVGKNFVLKRGGSEDIDITNRYKNKEQEIVEDCVVKTELRKNFKPIVNKEKGKNYLMKVQELDEDYFVKTKLRKIVKTTGKRKNENNYLPKIQNLVSDRHQSVSEQNIEPKIFACSSCSYIASSKCHLEIHIRFHEGNRPYQCTVCSKSFVTSSHLNRHMLIHNGTRKHVCVFCTKRFLIKSHLNQHMRMHTGDKRFTCKLCPRKFASSGNANKHMKTHDNYQETNPKTSSKKVAKEMNFECSICPRKYPYFSSLERHITAYHTGDKKFECPDCFRRFSQNSTLERHRWIHTNEKPHKCSFCDRRFTRSSCLINHCRNHHN